MTMLDDANCAVPRSQLRGPPPRGHDQVGVERTVQSAPLGGHFLGRYQVVDEIGVGGMATVHLARAHGAGGFEKWVALKRIHPHLAGDERFSCMFLDEARIAARISHPNVAQVFDLGEDGDTYWIAMEYLHGEMLLDLMRALDASAVPMSTAMAARIVADAADGLHAAHELRNTDGVPLNLVHRDVTPANLFLTYDGVVKVVDFGVAKAVGNLSVTGTGTLKGKLAYMSPEQVQGVRVDRRTDIFALGIVIWELTTGRRLFRVESDAETLERVQACVVPPPSSLSDSYPMELESVVMRALAKDRNDRFPTALELSRALRRYLVHAGACMGPEELGAYITRVLSDRRQRRDAQLRWAAEVIQTTSQHGVGAELSESARNHSRPRLGQLAALTPAPTGAPRAGASRNVTPPPLPTGGPRTGPPRLPAIPRSPVLDKAPASAVIYDYSSEDEDVVTTLWDRSAELQATRRAPLRPVGASASDVNVVPSADLRGEASARLATPPATSFPISVTGSPPDRSMRSNLLIGVVAAATTVIAVASITLAAIDFGRSRTSRGHATSQLKPVVAGALALARDAGQREARPISADAQAPAGAAGTPDAAPNQEAKIAAASRASGSATPQLSGTSPTASVAKATPRQPKRAKEPAPERAVNNSEQGFLTVMCVPGCDTVSAGGRSLGPSPIVRAALAPGKHALAFRRGSLRKSAGVVVVSGRSTALRMNMTD